jgi:hypothetical protein
MYPPHAAVCAGSTILAPAFSACAISSSFGRLDHASQRDATVAGVVGDKPGIVGEGVASVGAERGAAASVLEGHEVPVVLVDPEAQPVGVELLCPLDVVDPKGHDDLLAHRCLLPRRFLHIY